MILTATMTCYADDPVSFRKEVAPVLLNHCVACHCARKAEGGYRVDSFADLVKTGDSGIQPLQPNESGMVELVRRLTTEDESERMPADSDPLPDELTQVIADWVAGGAKFDGDDPTALLPLVIPPVEYPEPPVTYPAALQVTAIAFSPDGKTIVTGGYHELLFWSLDGTLVRRIPNLGQQTFAIAFNRDGSSIAVGCGEPGRNGEVRLVDTERGEVTAVLARCDDVVLDLAFRPDEKELAVASADKSIQIVDLQALEVTRTLNSHADWVTSVCWNQEGTRLVSASRDKSAKVFDAATGQLLVSYQGHNAAVRGVAITPDGKQVVSSGSDNKLHRWDVETAKKLGEVGLGGEGYRLVSGDGWVIAPTAAKTAVQMDVAKNSVTTTYRGHQEWVLAVASLNEPALVASGDLSGEVRIWNRADGSLIHSWVAKP